MNNIKFYLLNTLLTTTIYTSVGFVSAMEKKSDAMDLDEDSSLKRPRADYEAESSDATGLTGDLPGDLTGERDPKKARANGPEDQKKVNQSPEELEAENGFIDRMVNRWDGSEDDLKKLLKIPNLEYKALNSYQYVRALFKMDVLDQFPAVVNKILDGHYEGRGGARLQFFLCDFLLNLPDIREKLLEDRRYTLVLLMNQCLYEFPDVIKKIKHEADNGLTEAKLQLSLMYLGGTVLNKMTRKQKIC